jgi:beta-N-acetylhexosaminidase
VAVVEEGGNVECLSKNNGFPQSNSAASLRQRNDVAFTQAQGKAIAQTLASVGINLNLAPVVDLNLNRANRAIGGNGRSFSGDAGIATAHAAAFIAGHEAVGVRTAIKHFPGQGSAGGDTHLGVVNVTANWTDYELLPFKNLLAAGIVDAIMTGHIYNARLDSVYPATLSYATVTGLLREQLGYDGVVISDDLNMAAIKSAYKYEDALALAIGAGVDILTIADQTGTGIVERTIDIIAAHVANGAISEARIDASYARISALKARLLGA